MLEAARSTICKNGSLLKYFSADAIQTSTKIWMSPVGVSKVSFIWRAGSESRIEFLLFFELNDLFYVHLMLTFLRVLNRHTSIKKLLQNIPRKTEYWAVKLHYCRDILIYRKYILCGASWSSGLGSGFFDDPHPSEGLPVCYAFSLLFMF